MRTRFVILCASATSLVGCARDPRPADRKTERTILLSRKSPRAGHIGRAPECGRTQRAAKSVGYTEGEEH